MLTRLLILDQYLDRWMARLRRWPEWLSASLIIFGIALLVFGRALLRPSVMVSGSDFLQFYFWEDFTRSELLAGRLPLWNPYFFSGYPAAANPQMLLFYPPAMLLRLLPLSYAFGFGIWLHMGWLGLGMYYLSRHHNLSRPAALLAGICLMMSGIFVTHVEGGHLEWLSTLAWLPWVVWRWEILFASTRWQSVWLAGLVTALMLLGGALRVLACAGVMVGALALFQIGPLLWQRHWRELLLIVGRASVASLIAFGLAAPQLLPALELSALSSRAGGLPLECTNQFSLALSDFVYLGLSRPPFESFLEWERHSYIGALGVSLALIALWSNSRWKWQLVTWALLGGLLGVGPALPFYPLARWLVPFFGLVRQPFTFVVLITFAGAGLAGLGLDWLITLRSKRWPILIALGFLIFSFFVDLTLWQTLPAPEPSFYNRLTWLAAFSTPRYLAALLVIWLLTRLSFRRLAASLALVVSLIDLELFAYTHIPILPAASPQTQAAYVSPLAADSARVVTTPYMFSNQSMAVQVANAQGYAPIVIETYDAFVRGLNPREQCPSFEHAEINLGDSQLLQQLSVSRLLKFNGEVTDLPDPGPRTWWVGVATSADSSVEAIQQARSPNFDPYREVLVEGAVQDAVAGNGSGQALIVSYETQQVTITVDSTAAGWLVLNDVWYPGWAATIDGQPAPLLRANGTFRAVPVPAGQHTVKMEFHSTYLNIGLGCLIVTLLVIIALASRSRVRPTAPFVLADS